MKTTTYWKSGFRFDSQFKDNWIALDDASVSKSSNSGFGPKAMLLSGLAACTGIDIISILDKMKAPYTALRIEAEAEQTGGHLKVFKEINITYFIKVTATYEDKVKRAVHLSLDKYCGVAAMLRKHCPIHAHVVIE